MRDTKPASIITVRRSPIRNMTEGSIARHLLSFAAPMLVGNIFHQLYNMVDSVIVGNFVGPYSLGAIGTCSSLNFMTFGFCNGVSLGIGVVMAQFFGAGMETEVKKTIVNGSFLVLIITSVFSTVCTLLAPAILHLMRTPEAYIQESIIYFQITVAGMIGIAGYNAIAAMLRALGDSKTPLMFLVLASVLNILLDLLLVLKFGMGVAGVAVATVISQVVSALCCALYAVKTNPLFRIKREDLRIEWPLLRRCLMLGVPVGLQNSLISFSTVSLQGLVNGFGPDAATAYTMTLRLEQLIQQPYASLSAAISSFTGQNIGANKQERVRRGLRVGIVTTAIFSALMWLMMFLFGRPVLGIFGDEGAILDIAVQAIRITSCFYFPLGMIYLIRGLSNGAGDSLQALLNGVIEIICRIALGVLLTNIPVIGMWGIWITTASTWCITASECVIRYLQGKWKRCTPISS